MLANWKLIKTHSTSNEVGIGTDRFILSDYNMHTLDKYVYLYDLDKFTIPQEDVHYIGHQIVYITKIVKSIYVVVCVYRDSIDMKDMEITLNKFIRDKVC